MIRFTVPQLKSMLTLQDTMNKKVNPDWRAANYPWHRAALVECAELIDHLGWKWWKKQEPNMAQAHIEVVDIWHFSLSFVLNRLGENLDLVIGKMRDEESLGSLQLTKMHELMSNMHGEDEVHKLAVEVLAAQCAGDRFVPPVVVLWMAEVLGMTGDQIYRMYVAKNVLNIFRQDNGYKDGSYIKQWGGAEDNVFLEQLMTLMPEATPEQLQAELATRYAQVIVDSSTTKA